MRSLLQPRLENHKVFSSQNDEELDSFLKNKNFKMDLTPENIKNLDARFNGVYMPGMFLGYIQYGPAITTSASGRDDYWLQLPLQGKMEISDRFHSVVCDSTNAGIASPVHQNYYTMKSDENCGGIRVCFYKSTVVDVLTALLGEQPSKPLEFSPEIKLTSGYGASLSNYLKIAVSDFEQHSHIMWNHDVMRVFEQFILMGLLHSHPHNFSNSLQMLGKYNAPKAVKRAMDYIRANYKNPITIADIISVANVPGRTLFKHFRDSKGLSPMQYLRNIRFEQTRKRLLRSDARSSITDIALEEGFVHMGRFSVEYRRRYGESPSDTLRKQGRLI